METDELDGLIAESLAGVQTAIDGDKKVLAEGSSTSAGDAVRELEEGPVKSAADGVGSDVFFPQLVNSFQDESFQQSMAEALRLTDEKDISKTADASGPSTSADASSSGPDVEDFLKNFVTSFENAVSTDDGFGKQMTNMLESMLSKDIIIEPLQQISTALENWLKEEDASSLSADDKSKHESQLKLYQKIVSIYKNSDKDPLPADEQQEVQKLLAELNALGEPPAEVMAQITPKEAPPGDESFEDFVNAMGLGDNLGSAEQDLLKKLTENPDELTQVMKDMAGKLDGNGDEACKQQ